MPGVKGRSGPPGNKNRWTHGANGYRMLLEGTRESDLETDLYNALREKEKDRDTRIRMRKSWIAGVLSKASISAGGDRGDGVSEDTSP